MHQHSIPVVVRELVVALNGLPGSHDAKARGEREYLIDFTQHGTTEWLLRECAARCRSRMLSWTLPTRCFDHSEMGWSFEHRATFGDLLRRVLIASERSAVGPRRGCEVLVLECSSHGPYR